MGRYAIIVATGVYEDTTLASLRSTGEDCKSLGEVLSDPVIGGFTVTVLIDRPYHEIGEKVGEFLATRHRDDTVIVYFTCHGVRGDEGDLYFAATNTRLPALEDTAFPAARLARQLDRSRCRRALLLLDCCFSGAFSGALRSPIKGQVSLDDTIRRSLQGQGRVIITASTATEYAFADGELDEADPRGSLFTEALVHGLRSGDADLDRDGEVTCNELFRYLERRLSPRQNPTLSVIDMRGDMVVARSPIRSGPDGPKIGTLAEAVKFLLDDIEAVPGRLQPNPRAVSTGLTRLDVATDGLHPGSLTMIAAVRGRGAGVLVRDVARNAAIEQDVKTLYVDLETLPTNVTGSLLAAELKIPLTRIVSGTMSDQEWETLAEGLPKLTDAGMSLARTSGQDASDLTAIARSIPNLGLIAVCGADLFDQVSGTPLTPSALAAYLGGLARAYDLAVIASFGHSEPETTRVRAALGRHADVLLAVHLPPETQSKGDDATAGHLGLLMNAYGSTGVFPIVLDETYQTMRDPSSGDPAEYEQYLRTQQLREYESRMLGELDRLEGSDWGPHAADDDAVLPGDSVAILHGLAYLLGESTDGWVRSQARVVQAVALRLESIDRLEAPVTDLILQWRAMLRSCLDPG